MCSGKAGAIKSCLSLRPADDSYSVSLSFPVAQSVLTATGYFTPRRLAGRWIETIVSGDDWNPAVSDRNAGQGVAAMAYRPSAARAGRAVNIW